MTGTADKPLRHRPRGNSDASFSACGVRKDKHNIIVTPRLKNVTCMDCVRLVEERAAKSKAILEELLKKPHKGPLRRTDDAWRKARGRGI